jgi:hypothetical protein
MEISKDTVCHFFALDKTGRDEEQGLVLCRSDTIGYVQ